MADWIEKNLGISSNVQTELLVSVIIILVVWLIRKLLLRFFINNIEDVNQRYQWRKISLYVSVFIVVLFMLSTWLGFIGSLGTFLGLMTAGIAIALKDPLVNIVAWLFILVRQPFKVGDRIQIGENSGDVIDIRIFQFSLIEIGNWVDADQSTGRVIHIPNGIVFTQPQFNYTTGFVHIWHEIPILLTFESDWKKAKKILIDIVNKHATQFSEGAAKQIKSAAKKYLIFYSKLTPIVYTTIRDSGVLLTMRFLCEPRKRRSTEELILEEVLGEFGKCEDIDFAYPTTRFYNNVQEGKEGTRPKNQ
jgi:small-conductance mechanosensitive channel